MKITTLRIIDLWVGRPICWLMTVLYYAKHLIIRKPPPSEPDKILFIKLFGAGSLVLVHPTVRGARQRFPEAEIFFLTFAGNRQVLEMLGQVPAENVFTVRDDTLPHLFVDVWLCLVRLVRERIDVVIDLEFFSRFTAILSFAIRSQQRIGFYGFYTEGLRRGRFINNPVNYNHTLHTAKAFFTLLRPLGVGADEYDDTLPCVSPNEGYSGKMEKLLARASGAESETVPGRWLVLNPNASELSVLRRWPEEHFVALAQALLREFPDCGIALIGSSAEKPLVDRLEQSIVAGTHPGRLANLAGLTSLAELIDLFHFAALLVTNDSGPAHLAALAGIPTITIFGPETPELYAPLNPDGQCLYLGLDCQPCITIYNGKHTYCQDNQCLQRLSPKQVFDIAKSMLVPRKEEAESSRELS